jgi:hypothetical protein
MCTDCAKKLIPAGSRHKCLVGIVRLYTMRLVPVNGFRRVPADGEN